MANRTFKAAWSYGVVCLAAMSVSVLAGEYAARALHLSKTYESYPWRLNEWQRFTYAPERNLSGWRDREFTRRKEAGAYRIACIGDSVTEGYRVGLKSTFAKILEQMFQDEGNTIEVMNLGKSANATRENLVRLREALSFYPDLVVYQFGMNDIEGFEHAERVPDNEKQPADTRMRRTPGIKGLLQKSVLYLAVAERFNYLKLRMGRKNWAFGEWKITGEMWAQEFLTLRSVFREVPAGTSILMIYIPYDFQVYSDRKEVFSPGRKLAQFCRTEGYAYIDYTEVFKNGKNRYAIFLDDCHLSPYGHAIVAKELHDTVSKRFLTGR